MKRRSEKQSGFTLIELMVVVGVILILSGLLLFAISKVQARSQRLRARAAVRSIERSLIAYFYEYGNWPEGISGYGGSNPEVNYTGIEANSRLMRMLGGEDVASLNSREIVFLEPPGNTAVSGYLDPWRNPYKFMCDFDDDGSVHMYFTSQNGEETVPGKGVCVWSRGPDKSDELPFQKDDIRSW